MTLTPEERDELEDQVSDRLDDAPQAVHRIEVSLSRKNGLDYSLRCLGGPESRCHLWKDDEADPRTFGGHADCGAVEWWHYDTTSSVEGYVGQDRDSLVSGEVRLLLWGEDGMEWEYVTSLNDRL